MGRCSCELLVGRFNAHSRSAQYNRENDYMIAHRLSNTCVRSAAWDEKADQNLVLRQATGDAENVSAACSL